MKIIEAAIRDMLQWCVDHSGECLGDHPKVMERAEVALAASDALLALASSERTPRSEIATTRNAVLEEIAVMHDEAAGRHQAAGDHDNATMDRAWATAMRFRQTSPSATAKHPLETGDLATQRELHDAARSSVVECEKCAFRYGAEHTKADGTYECPVCELAELSAARSATRENVIEECAKFCEQRAGEELCDQRGFVRGDMGRELAAALREYVSSLPKTDCAIHGKLGSTNGKCQRC